MVRQHSRTRSRRHSRLVETRSARAFLHWLCRAPARPLGTLTGFALALAGLALVMRGEFRDPGRAGFLQVAVLAALAGFTLLRLFRRLRQSSSVEEEIASLRDLELGTLFISSVFVLMEMAGGPAGLLYPLVFALVAFFVAFHRFAHNIFFLALILLVEASIVAVEPDFQWPLFVSHASFILLFGYLYALFLRSEIAHRRVVMTREIKNELDRIDQEASDFRLTSGLSLESRELTKEELRHRRTVGSVQAIHDSFYNVLAVAEKALAPHTVAVLWLDESERYLRIKELRSKADAFNDGRIGAGEGFLGAVTKRRERLVLSRLKFGHSGLVYYRMAQPVTDFAAVPLKEGQHLRGILVADRTDGRPFDDADLSIMETVGEEIIRTVQVERALVDMDREKYRKERFYQASRDFNSALTVKEVAEVAIEAARRVSPITRALVVVTAARTDHLAVIAAEGDKLLTGQEFLAEESLVGKAIKARVVLPHGDRGTSQHLVLGPDIEFGCDIVKVLPLLWKDHGVGALVLGSETELTHDLIDMLRVIADHAAIAIANAQMYARMERMATTDGLTGLANHRHFQFCFDEALARANRYDRRLSLILTDIDHFKSVNDTYGHPMGDQVLKRVAALIKESARKTDVVARYGGEEFAVLMEESDANAAFQMAERIRNSVQAETFRSENGPFQCTLSLGVASFSDDGADKSSVIERADRNLYEAKHGGRNRTVVSRKRSRAAS